MKSLKIILFLLIAASTSILGQNILISDWKGNALENGGYVLLTPQGKVVSKFENINRLSKPSEGLMAAIDKTTSEDGFVDVQTGKWAFKIPKTYGLLSSFEDGLAIVERESPEDLNIKEFGAIDKTGNLAVPFTEGELSHFQEGLAAKKDPKKGNKYGFIDKTGNWVIPAKWTEVNGGFKEGLVAVAMNVNGNTQYGFIDKTGKVIVDYQWRSISPFREGLAAVASSRDDEKYGFIDKTGKMVIKPQFSMIYESFNDGVAIVSVSNGKTGKDAEDYYALIDKTGKILTNQKYQQIHPFSEGLAQVDILGDEEKGIIRVGFIDKTGKLVIPITHEVAEHFTDYGFKEGLAPVKKGYIDTKGNLIISFPNRGNLTEMKSFQNGITRLTIWNKSDDDPLFKITLIDKKGNILWESPENPPVF